MYVIRLADGTLRVPQSLTSEDGQLIGNAYVEIEPGEADYERWLPEALTEEEVAARRLRWAAENDALEREFLTFKAEQAETEQTEIETAQTETETAQTETKTAQIETAQIETERTRAERLAAGTPLDEPVLDRPGPEAGALDEPATEEKPLEGVPLNDERLGAERLEVGGPDAGRLRAEPGDAC